MRCTETCPTCGCDHDFDTKKEASETWRVWLSNARNWLAIETKRKAKGERRKMEGNHTREPWESRFYKSLEKDVITANDERGRIAIATLIKYQAVICSDLPVGEYEANKRLIMKAPELCRQLTDLYEAANYNNAETHDNTRYPDVRDTLNFIYAGELYPTVERQMEKLGFALESSGGNCQWFIKEIEYDGIRAHIAITDEDGVSAPISMDLPALVGVYDIEKGGEPFFDAQRYDSLKEFIDLALENDEDYFRLWPMKICYQCGGMFLSEGMFHLPNEKGFSEEVCGDCYGEAHFEKSEVKPHDNLLAAAEQMLALDRAALHSKDDPGECMSMCSVCQALDALESAVKQVKGE